MNSIVEPNFKIKIAFFCIYGSCEWYTGPTKKKKTQTARNAGRAIQTLLSQSQPNKSLFKSSSVIGRGNILCGNVHV